MQTLESHTSRVLFLNKNDEDTAYLTRDLPMEVVRAARIEDVRREIYEGQIDGVVMDVASTRPKDILAFRENTSGPAIPLFVLADTDELPLAIEYVKLGAQGFLVKGLSDSDSVLKLMQYATSQH